MTDGMHGGFRTWLDLPLGLFLLSALVGMAVSYDISQSLPLLTALLIGGVLYYASFGVVSLERGSVLLAGLLMGCGVLLAGYFVTQYGHIAYPIKNQRIHDWGETLAHLFPRVGTWQPHPNYVAAFLEGLLPVGIAASMASSRWVSKLLWGAGSALVGLALVMTVSRGAWVALAFVFVLGGAALSRVLRWLLFGLIAATALFCAGYLVVVDGASLQSIPFVGSALAGLALRPDRWTVWTGSIYLLQDMPYTGIGLGKTFPMVYSRYVLLIPYVFLTYSHSLVLEIWLQQGILGLLGFLWLCFALYRLVWRVGRAGHPARPLFHGAWLGVTVILVHGLFDAGQYAAPWTFLPFFSLLGLSVATAGSSRGLEPSTARRSAPRLFILSVVGIAAALALVFWRPFVGAIYANRGALRQARVELSSDLPADRSDGLLVQARANYERAAAVWPGSRTARQRLGILDMSVGHYDDAVAHLEAALRNDPHNTTTHRALGLAYMWVGRLENAEPLLAAVPNVVQELNTWGWWRQSQGERELAQRAYRMSLRLQPDQAGVEQALARLNTD
jgi:putative inorganic carbon (hco3(-)) transporter